MRISAALGTLVLLSATSLTAAPLGDDCSHAADRKAAAQAAGVTKVVVHGEAGALVVEGRAGVTDVVAAGRACTSDRDLLDDITLTARRSGNTLYIDAHVPDKVVIFGFFEARLDFTVTLPQSVAVEVHDGSGGLKVANVASASIEDGSGSMNVRGVRGPLRITDGSGEIDVDGAGGDVTIEDGSGDVTVRNVTGSVRLDDGSGEIEIATVGGGVVIDDGSGSIDVSQVRQAVTVEDDGSGSIDVADVGGDFVVRAKGSGSIHHSRVAGRVTIPQD